MRINHNLMAMNAKRYLTTTGSLQGKSLEKISSGLRINTAADDAAGLAISEKMRAQIKGLEQSSRNAQDGISLIQTAEGALSETHSILQRMRELAVQATNGTNTDSDRADMQKEVQQLKSEIDRIATDTEFNKKALLNGGMGKKLTVDVANTEATLENAQAIGAELGNGTYQITFTGITDGALSLTNNSIGDLEIGEVALTGGANAQYGSYKLELSNLAGTVGDLTLTGPDGTVTTSSGVDFSGAVTVGDFTITDGATAVSADGIMYFDLTADLTATMTAGGTAAQTITGYKGEAINLGGFEFSLKTGFGVNNDTWDASLVDNSVQFQIGANANQAIDLGINDMSSNALGVKNIDISSTVGAEAAITTIQSAIEKVSGERSKLGAVQNRLEHTIKNLDTSAENLQASESRIRDVDIAKEMMNYTKLNILQQAAQSMLAQANQAPQGVLQLLR